MPRYDAVIFDLDGTLLNTLDDLADSVNYALALHAMSPRTLEEIRSFVGNGVGALVERAVPKDTASGETARVLADFKAHYQTNMDNKTAPYPGILDLLRELRDRGFLLAVVSNKFDAAVKELCQRYFPGLIPVAIGESPTVARKPAPDTALEALRQLGVAADRAVYVGDSDVDIQTARNAGVACISVTWGFRDRAFLTTHGAERIIDAPADLARYL